MRMECDGVSLPSKLFAAPRVWLCALQTPPNASCNHPIHGMSPLSPFLFPTQDVCKWVPAAPTPTADASGSGTETKAAAAAAAEGEARPRRRAPAPVAGVRAIDL